MNKLRLTNLVLGTILLSGGNLLLNRHEKTRQAATSAEQEAIRTISEAKLNFLSHNSPDRVAAFQKADEPQRQALLTNELQNIPTTVRKRIAILPLGQTPATFETLGQKTVPDNFPQWTLLQ